MKRIKTAIKRILPATIVHGRMLKPPLPKHVYMDPSSACHLHCPLCPTGANTINLPRRIMKFDDFKKYIDQIPTVEKLDLYNWGEPFLNPDIIRIIKYAKEKNIYTVLDSNLSLALDEKKMDEIVTSGLDELRVALDGASEKSYSEYRKGGNFKLVMENMKRLRIRQKIVKTQTPRILWKFLVHKHNEHELQKAEKMAISLDVQLIFEKFMLSEYIPDVDVTPGVSLKARKEHWLPKNEKFVQDEYKRPNAYPRFPNTVCPYLFSSPVIHPDGTVLPCCYASDIKSSFGNLKIASFKQIWHSKKYQYARSLFVPGAKAKRIPVVCEKCPVFKPINLQ